MDPSYVGFSRFLNAKKNVEQLVQGGLTSIVIVPKLCRGPVYVLLFEDNDALSNITGHHVVYER